MSDVLTALTRLAVSVFRDRDKPNYLAPDNFRNFVSHDPVLQMGMFHASVSLIQTNEITDVARIAFSDPELAHLATRDGELDPMVLWPRGGARMSPSAFITGILSSAFLQMFYLQLPEDEPTFARLVLEGFQELKRAAGGELIRAQAITGIARATLPRDVQISTPWGIIRAAPVVSPEQISGPFAQPTTTCILAETRQVRVKFDRESSPQFSPDQSDAEPYLYTILLPLACALASRESAKPVVPVMTWSSMLLPFQTGFGYAMPLLPPTFPTEVNLGDMIEDLQEWARIVDRSHTPTVDIAARRLVSATSNIMDRGNALIDAVMVWENLVGTSSEVTFRVTAALAKMLESDATKRRALRKHLAKIYGIRSRIVHAVAVDTSAVDDACSDAVDVAVRALRVAYGKGREWLELTSEERADTILLEWQ